MIGINLSGAEFGSIGGKYGTSYIYPSANDLKFYTERGVELVRLPVKWERLQPTANGELDKAELGRLKAFLDAATAQNVKVIVDIHNYGSYYGEKIGSSNVTNSQFADFWQKLAREIGGIKSVYGYDLMNEPNKMGDPSVWPLAAQAAVDAIRTVDMNTKIYVEGNSWASAANWSKNNALLDIKDPASKIVYEAHIYFDRTASGTYKESYDAQGATADIGVKAIQDFVGWLAERGAEGFIGEFAVPDNDPRWLTVLDNFLGAMQDAGLDGTYWGAGPWWGNYPLALRNADGTESVQLDVLEKYIGAAAASAVLTTGSAAASATPLGTDKNDTLYGTDRAEVINGLKGNDVIEGRGGADHIDGGEGIDVASYITSTNGVHIELTATVQKGGAAEGDVLINVESIHGSNYNDVLKGNAGANVLNGFGGDDLFLFSGGSDKMDGGEGVDTVDFSGASDGIVANLATGTASTKGSKVALAGIENIIGTEKADTLTGDTSANVLIGGAGNDILDGGVGADTMRGGAGNDVFTVDDIGDIVIEEIGGGADAVHTMLDRYVLSANVEKLVLAGTANLAGTGNGLNNTLVGNDGANVLYGLEGADTLHGGLGNDTLYGGDGNDTLNGGAGADTMHGGMGDDVYYVDNNDDIVKEDASSGIDTVRSSIANYALNSNVDNLILDGTGGQIGIGNELSNKMTGSVYSDTLIGGAGNDQIDGQAGADRLEGGTGNDTYYVDNLGDVLVELAGEGVDTARVSVSGYTLSANVENLTLTGREDLVGSGNSMDNILTGNAGANLIHGGAGNDQLNGGAGADRLWGDDGDDVLGGGLDSDWLYGGAGKDVFKFAAADSAQSNPDIIWDFVRGTDIMDLSAIDANANKGGNQAFSFIGTNSFSHSAGQLRYEQAVDANGQKYSLLQADMNGDGVSDFAIHLHAFTGVLTHSDFLL
jgi:Ca2+-binding RTX toxin-like protein